MQERNNLQALFAKAKKQNPVFSSETNDICLSRMYCCCSDNRCNGISRGIYGEPGKHVARKPTT